MELSFYIAWKIIRNKQKGFSRFITHLSIVAIGVSVAIMILGISFMNGFEEVVEGKAYSFLGHIRIEPLVQDNSYDYNIRTKEFEEVKRIIKNEKEILYYSNFALKYGVVISGYSLDGLAFKGYSKDFNPFFFKSFLKRGRWLKFNDSSNYANEIVISDYTSRRLKLDTNSSIIANFIESNGSQRKRKLFVVGIYKTGIEDYDKSFGFVDLALIQHLNNWNHNFFHGYEVFIRDLVLLENVNRKLYFSLPSNWTTRTTREMVSNLFDWVELLHVNKWVLIIILSCVAIINIISCMATFVLDKSRMIGILKTLGMPPFDIQKIFIYYASYVSFMGVFWGLLLGIILSLLQQYFGLIRLNEAVYFVENAPVKIVFWQIVLILLISIVICFLILILPSYYIQRLKPIKSIQIKS